MGEKKNEYNILAGKPEGKRDLSGGLGTDGEDDIKMELKEMGYNMWSGFMWLLGRARWRT